jgi:hypothetical protein
VIFSPRRFFLTISGTVTLSAIDAPSQNKKASRSEPEGHQRLEEPMLFLT